MILDGFLLFTGTSNGASGGITNDSNSDSPTTGTQTASNIIDLGLSGIPTSANGGGARDIGTGFCLKLLAMVKTALTGGTSIQVALAGAPDDGTGSPGSYTTMWTSEAVLEADLVAGAQIANVDVPLPVPGQVLPRFLRLQFISSGTHGAGAIVSSIVLDRIDVPRGANAGILSGYPAGVDVSGI